jgi:hypothetical protein
MLSECWVHVDTRDLNLRPSDKELGAVTKWLSSPILQYSESRQVSLQNIVYSVSEIDRTKRKCPKTLIDSLHSLSSFATRTVLALFLSVAYFCESDKSLYF